MVGSFYAALTYLGTYMQTAKHQIVYDTINLFPSATCIERLDNSRTKVCGTQYTVTQVMT